MSTNTSKLKDYLTSELKNLNYEIEIYPGEVSSNQQLFIVELSDGNINFTLQFQFLKSTEQWQVKRGGFFWNISLVQDCSGDHQWAGELIQATIGESKETKRKRVAKWETTLI